MIVSPDEPSRSQVRDLGIPVKSCPTDLLSHFENGAFDWLISIGGRESLATGVLSLPRRGAIRFHDGPLPDYAGCNTPSWVLMNREKQHGVTWHRMTRQPGRGDILQLARIDITDDETAATLAIKCRNAGASVFLDLLGQLDNDPVKPLVESQAPRRSFSPLHRPTGAGRLDFHNSAEALAATVRALDFGPHWNPLTCAKIVCDGTVLLVRTATMQDLLSSAQPGTVLTSGPSGIVVATGDSKALLLGGLCDFIGNPLDPAATVRPGQMIASPGIDESARLSGCLQSSLMGEAYWRKALQSTPPVTLPQFGEPSGDPIWSRLELPGKCALEITECMAGVLHWAQKLSGQERVDLALSNNDMATFADNFPEYASAWVPVQAVSGETHRETAARLELLMDCAQHYGGFACDLMARDPAIVRTAPPVIGVSCGHDAPIPGSAVTVVLMAGQTVRIFFDTSRIDGETFSELAAELDEDLRIALEIGGEKSTGLPSAIRWQKTGLDAQTAVEPDSAGQEGSTLSPRKRMRAAQSTWLK